MKRFLLILVSITSFFAVYSRLLDAGSSRSTDYGYSVPELSQSDDSLLSEAMGSLYFPENARDFDTLIVTEDTLPVNPDSIPVNPDTVPVNPDTVPTPPDTTPVTPDPPVVTHLLHFTWVSSETCIDTVDFINNSVGYDFFIWVIDDDQKYYSRNLTGIVFDFTGKHTVKLIGSTTDGTMTDSIIHQVVFYGKYTKEIVDSVCRTNPITLFGKKYDRPGIYYDTSFVGGCPSVTRIKLGHTHGFRSYTRTLCSPDTVMLGSQIILYPGVYHDTIISPYGCDSVIELIAVKPPDVTYRSISICAGSSYTIDTVTFTESGTYVDTFYNRYGCDSIVVYNVTVHPKVAFVENVTLCEGTPYTYHGTTYTKAGTYRYSYIDENGCPADSILNLHYNHVHKSRLDTIHEGQSFNWRGRVLSSTGFYSDTVIDQYGCDSIFDLHLLLKRPYTFYEKATICGDSYVIFGGDTVRKSGLYYDSLKSLAGEDSVIILSLTANPVYHFYDTVMRCDTFYVYPNHDTIFYKSGDYDVVHQTVSGCDSIYHLHLVLNWVNIFYETQFLGCDHPSYYWRGRVYNQVGRYIDHYTDIHGCDSDYVLILTAPTGIDTMDVCEGQQAYIRGKLITEPGRYMDTIFSPCGIYDSIVTIIVNILKTEYVYDTVRICDGGFYNFHGRHISAPGIYYDSLKTPDGCNKIYQLKLEVVPNYYHLEYLTLCSDTAYQWRNKSIFRNGAYFDSIKSQYGCDSVYELRITFHPPVKTIINEHICQGETYFFGRQALTESGVYHDTMKTSYGCDSVIELVLNVTPKYVNASKVVICDGHSFDFRGKILTQAGTYHDTLKSISGCDSIYQLEVEVKKPYLFIEFDTVCSNTTLMWHNRSLNETGVYYDSLLSTTGCDSVYELHLTKYPVRFTRLKQTICQGSSIKFGNRYCSEPGVYNDTLKTVYGCDSILQLTLNITPSIIIAEHKAICRNDYYTWRGRKVTVEGKYVDSLKMKCGCDSIYELYLTVAEHFYDVRFDTTYANLPYQWRGRTLTYSGTYYDSLISSSGCDSVYCLHLLYNTSHLIQQTVRLCPGESCQFRGRVLTEPGTYYDSLMTPEGNDSIFRLDLYRIWDFHNVQNVRICQGSSYSFRGRTLTSPGTYYDSLKTVEGCDSIYELKLSVDSSYLFNEYVSICSNDPYQWHNQILYSSGTYYDSMTARNGCDSIHKLVLDLNHTYFVEKSVTLCNGQSYFFKGRQISTDGIYFDTLFSTRGCDSIIKLVVQVIPKYEFYDTVKICRGEFYRFGGRNLRSSGDYMFRDKTVKTGCDSVTYLHLVVDSAYHFVELDTVCQGQPYLWHGRYLDETGIYFDSLQTVHGCDSVHELRLIFNNSYMIDRHISLCEGESYYFGGKDYSKPGIFYDTLNTIHGCDSIIKLVISVHRDHHFYDTVDICKGDFYNFRGRCIYNPGTYYDSLHTRSNLCDSIYEVLVRVKPSYHFIERDTLCTSEPYIWRGKSITGRGVYFDSLVTEQGCDSVYELQLELRHAYHLTRNISLCPGQSYIYRNKTFTDPGIYTDSLATIEGCDSIITIVITRNYQHDLFDTAQICRGDYYDFFGRKLTSPGAYTEVKKTSGYGCDSIYHLWLTVNPEYRTVEYDTLCTNEYYLWHGRHLTRSGIYYDTLPTQMHCDSVFELRLTLNPINQIDFHIQICEGQTYIYRNKVYSQPGVYYDTIVASSGCDSIFRIVVSVSPDYLLSDTVQICDGNAYEFRGKTYNSPGVYRDTLPTVGTGCDSIFELILQTAPTYHFIEYDTVCTNGTYSWRSKIFTESGVYYDSLRSRYGCDSVYELRLTIYDIPVVELYREICFGESFIFNNKTYSAAGTYYDTLRSVHGCDSIMKLTVNVTPLYLFSDTVKVCSGDAYNFRGQICTMPGVYRDTLKTVSGCDSIFEVVIQAVHTFHFIDYDTICTNGNYVWRNKSFTQTGIYYDSLRSRSGCDSVYELRLTVYSVPLVERYQEICQGSSFFFRGHNISEQGVYYDTILTRHGCDSVIKLTLVVTPDYLFSDTVQICDGSVYMFRGRRLASPGIYRDTLLTKVSGCDSIYEMVVKTAPTYLNIEYDTVCSNSTYYWRGRDLVKSGVYYDSLFTQSGCDSVYALYLQKNSIVLDSRYVEICQGQTYYYRGRNYSRRGVYYDTIYSQAGCDSILRLVLNVSPTYLISDTVQICNGNAYKFRNRTLTSPGTYRDTLHTAGSGCDSIYELVLRTAPTSYFVEYDTICSNGTYIWRGQHITKSGVYFDSLRNQSGCDSVYELRLTVNPHRLVEVYQEICEGDRFWFRGTDLTKSGVYYDYLHTVHGCDSIVKLTLNVTPTYFFSDTVHFCKGDAYNFRGKSVHQPGVYRDTQKTVSGCDSIYQLVLVANPTYHSLELDTICSNGTYFWRGRQLSGTGTYFDTLRTAENCDSVFELRLTVYPVNFSERYVEICHGQSMRFNDLTITTPGTYYDTVSTVHGCDSIIKLNLTIAPEYFFSDTVHFCKGDAYNFHGRVVTKPGVYRDTLSTNVSGCDSVREVVLVADPVYHFLEYDTVCSNYDYEWRDMSLSSSGTYFDTLFTMNGCDSVYELRLTINPVPTEELYMEICQGQTFRYKGRDLSQTGVYYDTVHTVHGCDSIVKLTLNVAPTYVFRDTVMICDGDAYDFHGTDITRPGTYRDTLKTKSSGCDSIFELVLIVAPTYHFIELDTICSDGSFQWHGQNITSSGTYFDTMRTIYGCDSVFELRLVAYPVYTDERYVQICQGQSFSYRGQNYSQTGTYYDVLKTVHGCDSVFKLTVNVTPNYIFRDTAIICNNSTYDFYGTTISKPGTYRHVLQTVGCGCDSIYELTLLTASTYHFVEYDTVCTNGSVFWHGKSLFSTGVYFDSLHSSDGCDSIYELRLTINPIPILEMYMEICQGQSFFFRGRNYSQTGVYYDTINTVHGCDSIHKLTLNVTPTYFFRDTAFVCDGDSFDFQGRRLTFPGTYHANYKTASGCDSIYELTLLTAQTYHFIEYDTLCSDTPYYWRSHHYTESGVYYDSLQTVHGCDSVYELRLQYNKRYVIQRYISLCDGQSYQCGNRSFSQPGVYFDSLLTVKGCDSIIRYVVNVTHKFVMTDSADICDGDYYDFHGRRLIYPGVYYDSLKTAVSGCDSVYILHLGTRPSYRFIEYDTICSNLTYNWRGRTYTQSGTYYDSLQTRELCDSVYELRLLVYPTYLQEYQVNICDGQSYRFHNRTLTRQGIYYDSLQSTHGCDSVIKLILTIRPRYMLYDTVQICNGDSYNFRNRIVNKAGIYWDSLKTVDGCDSIYQLCLKVAPRFHSIENDSICSNTTYTWRGMNLSVTGVYFDSLKSENGCDSVYELRLHVFTPKVTIMKVEICHGTSFHFNGKNLTQPGTYRDTLQRSVQGCDSIVELVLSVASKYLFTDSVTICHGDSFYFRNRHIRQSGTYYDTLHTVRSGCDSIYKLVLNVLKRNYTIIDTTICTNSYFDFNGRSIIAPGTYYDTLKTSFGCDSFIELRIRFSDPSLRIIRKTICSRQHYTSPTGKVFNTSGIYYDTLFSAVGCDSVFQIILNVVHNVVVYDTAHVVRGHTYYYHGKTYPSSGDFYDTAVSVLGCDTFFELHIVQIDSVVVYLDTTFCDNHPIRYRGKTYSTSKTDTFDIKSYSTLAPDTVLIFTTHVFLHSDTTLSDSTCDGRPYMFNGKILTRSGYYSDTLHRFNGCDSIINLHLIIFDRKEEHDSATICETESFTWHNRMLTQPGIYYDTIIDVESGCNIYCFFTLHVIRETKIISANSMNPVEACWDESNYTVYPTFSGPVPTHYSLTYDAALQHNNIQNAQYDGVSITIPIPKDGTNQNVIPGHYPVTLSVGNGVCDATPYAASFDLLVRYPSYILEQHFNNVVSIFGRNRNGGYDFDAFRWYVNGSIVQGATESNLYYTALKDKDVVYASIRRTGETDFIPTCEIIIEDLGPEPADFPVMLQSSYHILGQSHALLTSTERGRYALYDMKGMLICSGDISADGDTEVPLPYISGCYLLHVTTDTAHRTFKLIVR